MFRNSLMLLTLLTMNMGCTQFIGGRNFLSDAGSDRESYFNPQEDFPVVAGDREYGLTAEQFRRRMPTAEDRKQQRFQSSLEQELRSLENSQTEEDSALYEKHKKYFSSTSEKIYFLKLPYYEREGYLEAKGMNQNRRPASVPPAVNFGVRKNEIGLGMNKTDVKISLGHPLRVEVAGNPANENERWAYNINGRTKYVYFESGVVQGWE